MKRFCVYTVFALLLLGSASLANALQRSSPSDNQETAEISHLQQFCGRVRQLVFERRQGEVVNGVVTIQSDEGTVHLKDETLAIVLAYDFLQVANQPRELLYQPTIQARFGQFLRDNLVVLCIQKIRVKETVNDHGVVVRSGSLVEDSLTEHTIFL
jgi:hypothetical protein